jgi:WXG100 family type VII secretion target
MKTAYQVKVAFKGAASQADNIDNIAKTIEKKRANLAEARMHLSGNWTGDNSQAYQTKMQEREQELLRIVNDLKNIAATIRKVAKNSYDADMKSIKIAQQNAAKIKNKKK